MASNPFSDYRYRVELDGVEVAGFTEVSGCDVKVEAVKYREGSMLAPRPAMLTGPRKYGNITLKRGLTNSMDMFNWINPSFDTDAERKTVTIILRNENNEDVAKWQLLNSWPVKYTAPELVAAASEIAIEQLELAHEGLTRIK